MAAKKHTADSEITNVLKVSTADVVCCLVGTSPLVLNRMSEKAKHELLMPKPKERGGRLGLKHNPPEEYRASAYTLKDGPTLLALMATAFKGSLRSAALDMPGMKKAQIGRLTYIEGEYVGIYGVPKLYMSIVRSADMNRTPDVRTRAIVPEWACQVRITHVVPLIRSQAVTNLLAAAGVTIGVGDGRPEKGAMNFGQFRIVAPTDPDYVRIVKAGGRKAQQAALETPVCYDDETTELLSWFQDERQKRELRGVA